jgi:LPXTG-motif cell wall-anchored protein
MAIIFTGQVFAYDCDSTKVSTQVYNGSGALTSGSNGYTTPEGSTVYDVATLWDTTSGNRYDNNNDRYSGKVDFRFFDNLTCTGDGTDVGTVTVTDGTATSGTEGSLVPGDYAFEAAYSGDGWSYNVDGGFQFTYNGNGNWNWDPNSDKYYHGSKGTCEPFKVAPAVTTTAIDAGTSTTWSNPETAGASVYDTATVGPAGDDGPIDGTVAYSFYDSADCSGTAIGAGGGAVTDGTGANSDTEGPLAAGTYSFEATFTPAEDSPYIGATGVCEDPDTGLVVTTAPTPVPTATPTGSVLAASTPSTGAGASGTTLGVLGIALLLFGSFAFVFARRSRKTHIQNI